MAKSFATELNYSIILDRRRSNDSPLTFFTLAVYNLEEVVPQSPSCGFTLPWVIDRRIYNLNEVVADCVRAATNEFAATPLGLTMFDGRLPKVARASQPWALGRNPVGIRERSATL